MKKTVAIVTTLIATTLLLTACKTNDMKTTTPTAPIKANDTITQDESAKTMAVITTSMGEISVKLFEDKAPETVKNFVELSKMGKYDGVTFHRVINDFMIQTGDFENHNGTGGYTYKGPGTVLPDELAPGLTHKKGVLSMANAGPGTAASQFFIVQKEGGTQWLDGVHTIFGEVTAGMDVVDAIATVETAGMDAPIKKVTINKIEIK